MPLFGAPAVNPRYHYLAGNAAALPWMLYAVVVGAGFGEETVFRGFLFQRLGKLLGARRAALAATVLLTSGLFALAHYHDQGLPGVEQAAMTGLVFGTIYGVTRQLWLPMVAHAAFDVYSRCVDLLELGIGGRAPPVPVAGCHVCCRLASA